MSILRRYQEVLKDGKLFLTPAWFVPLEDCSQARDNKEEQRRIRGKRKEEEESESTSPAARRQESMTGFTLDCTRPGPAAEFFLLTLLRQFEPPHSSQGRGGGRKEGGEGCRFLVLFETGSAAA